MENYETFEQIKNKAKMKDMSDRCKQHVFNQLVDVLFADEVYSVWKLSLRSQPSSVFLHCDFEKSEITIRRWGYEKRPSKSLDYEWARVNIEMSMMYDFHQLVKILNKWFAMKPLLTVNFQSSDKLPIVKKKPAPTLYPEYIASHEKCGRIWI